MTRSIFKYDKQLGAVVKVWDDGEVKESVAPAFFRDEILDGVESPLTGEKFYSMCKYKQHLKEHGYEITGGSHLKGRGVFDPGFYKPDPEDIRNDVRKAENDLRYGNAPLTDWEKEVCQREQRQLEAYKKRQKTSWAR